MRPSTRKVLENIEANINELLELAKSGEYEKLKKDKEELEQIKERLSHVRLKIKEVRAFDGEELGARVIRITYQPIVITLKMDNEGKVEVNDFLKNTNLLGMLGIDDMMKIQKVISAEKLNKSDK